MTNHCGTCTACCKVYSIPELEKPAGKWCQHCAIGKECKIYDARPKACVEFECMWLISQRMEGAEMPQELRPDRSRVVFAPTTNKRIISGLTAQGHPLAWQRPDVLAFIKRILRNGFAVALGSSNSDRQLLLKPDGTRREIRMSEPDKDGMRYNLTALEDRQ